MNVLFVPMRLVFRSYAEKSLECCSCSCGGVPGLEGLAAMWNSFTPCSMNRCTFILRFCDPQRFLSLRLRFRAEPVNHYYRGGKELWRWTQSYELFSAGRHVHGRGGVNPETQLRDRFSFARLIGLFHFWFYFAWLRTLFVSNVKYDFHIIRLGQYSLQGSEGIPGSHYTPAICAAVPCHLSLFITCLTHVQYYNRGH